MNQSNTDQIKQINLIKDEYSYLLYKLTLYYKFNFDDVKKEFHKVTEHKFSHIELENEFIKNCFRSEFGKAKSKPSQPKMNDSFDEKVKFEQQSDTTSQIINENNNSEMRTNSEDTNTEHSNDELT